MGRISIVAALVVLASPLAYSQVGKDPAPYVPRLTLSTGYQFIRSNAPPNVSNRFSSNGGYVSAAVAMKYWLRAAGEVTGSHANNIGPLGQNLNLITYTFGPQLVLHSGRFEPHAQVLFGGAHGFDSYFPKTNTYSTSANSFAFQTGGGLDVVLSHRIGVRALEVQYLRTGFPNGVDGKQNHLMVGAGITFRLHGHMWAPDPGRERHKADKAMNGMSRSPGDPKASVAPPPPPATSPEAATPLATPAIAANTPSSSMMDAYFDYDSSELRPDAKDAIRQTAQFLNAHPEAHVVVGGYADERGSAEYDVALGERRAQAARDALIANGISPDRLEVVSYGKEVQICKAENESCFQKNRRADFKVR